MKRHVNKNIRERCTQVATRSEHLAQLVYAPTMDNAGVAAITTACVIAVCTVPMPSVITCALHNAVPKPTLPVLECSPTTLQAERMRG